MGADDYRDARRCDALTRSDADCQSGVSRRWSRVSNACGPGDGAHIGEIISIRAGDVYGTLSEF